jgi:predicted transcriptional regulator
MGKRNRVTTRDIAEELGISQSTVSMILSNKANVSFTEETVQKVKTKAKELGYKKPVPKELVQEKSLANTIVVLCPMVTNGYYSMMMQSITDHAKEYDYTVMTISTGRDAATEELYLDLFARVQLAGIIHCQKSRKSMPSQSVFRLSLLGISLFPVSLTLWNLTAANRDILWQIICFRLGTRILLTFLRRFEERKLDEFTGLMVLNPVSGNMVFL